MGTPASVSVNMSGKIDFLGDDADPYGPADAMPLHLLSRRSWDNSYAKSTYVSQLPLRVKCEECYPSLDLFEGSHHGTKDGTTRPVQN
jgi:hypothetical protein